MSGNIEFVSPYKVSQTLSLIYYSYFYESCMFRIDAISAVTGALQETKTIDQTRMSMIGVRRMPLI